MDHRNQWFSELETSIYYRDFPSQPCVLFAWGVGHTKPVPTSNQGQRSRPPKPWVWPEAERRDMTRWWEANPSIRVEVISLCFRRKHMEIWHGHIFPLGRSAGWVGLSHFSIGKVLGYGSHDPLGRFHPDVLPWKQLSLLVNWSTLRFCWLPSDDLTQLLKMAIYSEVSL